MSGQKLVSDDHIFITIKQTYTSAFISFKVPKIIKQTKVNFEHDFDFDFDVILWVNAHKVKRKQIWSLEVYGLENLVVNGR